MQALLHDLGLLVLRAGAGGLLFLGHGLPKLLNFSARMETFRDPLGVGSAASLTLTVFAEVGCALLVAVGLGTRLAAAPVLIMFAVILTLVEGSAPWPKQELALMYTLPFAAIALMGPGRFSLDWLIRKKS